MSKTETCIKDRSLEDEGENTFKYAITNLKTNSKSNDDNKIMTNIIKVQRQEKFDEEMKKIESLNVNKENNHKLNHVNRGKSHRIKLDMVDENIKNYEDETKLIEESNLENTKLKIELQDKLFKVNELLKLKQQQIEKINDDLKANQTSVSIDKKENKFILTCNIVFFIVAFISLLYLNLSSNAKYKTRRRLSTIKSSVLIDKKERLFNSNNNDKKIESLYNNNNMKKQKKVLGLNKNDKK
jgi:hypothetical protein